MKHELLTSKVVESGWRGGLLTSKVGHGEKKLIV